MDSWRFGKIEVAALIITIIITIISASAAPLDVSIEEKINTTANYTGSGFVYTTNVTGYVNITNKGNDDLYDVWVVLHLTNISSGPTKVFDNSSSGAFLYSGPSKPSVMPDSVWKNLNTSDATDFIHIPHLRPNEKVSIFYDVNDTKMGINSSSPFNITETYNVSKIPAKRDVAWKVWLNVSLNETWFDKTCIDLTNNNVSMTVTKYLSNQTTTTCPYGSGNWTLLKVSGTPDAKNGGGSVNHNVYSGNCTGAQDSTIVFSNILLNTTGGDKYVNMTFNVTGNNSGSGRYFLDKFGFAAIDFSLTNGGNVSCSKVLDVFAIGNATISVNKSGPFQNASDEWSLWRGNATITNTANNLKYKLTNVTLWATNASAGGFTTIINDEYSGNPVLIEFNSSNSWYPVELNSSNPSNTTPTIEFNFSYVPVIWANATFELIKDTGSGWYANSTTMNASKNGMSDFIVIEKIYVIGSYLIKVTKHVIPNASAGPNVFDVYLVVENLGGQESPYVYVYDMIPTNFSEYSWDTDWTDVGQDGNWVNKSQMFAGNGSVNNPASGYDKGYWWHLNPLNGSANGDGSYTDWQEIANNQSVVIFYQMQGNGEFRVLDAFVVGIDPMLSMNEQTSPKITIVSGSASTSYESVMALLTGIAGIAAMVTYRRRG